MKNEEESKVRHIIIDDAVTEYWLFRHWYWLRSFSLWRRKLPMKKWPRLSRRSVSLVDIIEWIGIWWLNDFSWPCLLSGLVREHIPTEKLNSVEVWEALVQKMPMTAMIRNLAKMQTIGLLAGYGTFEHFWNTTVGCHCTIKSYIYDFSENVVKVANEVKDKEALKKARVHPIQVSNYWLKSEDQRSIIIFSVAPRKNSVRSGKRREGQIDVSSFFTCISISILFPVGSPRRRFLLHSRLHSMLHSLMFLLLRRDSVSLSMYLVSHYFPSNRCTTVFSFR